MDLLFLSRLQFGLTVAFHYIYPPMSIGLGVILVVTEALWLRTGREIYHRMAHFWTRVFGLTFAIGVATGIVMEFQFGTNWARYSRYVGDIFGAPLAIEAIFTFFLESAFVGLILFGRDRVSSTVRWIAGLLVAFGWSSGIASGENGFVAFEPANPPGTGTHLEPLVLLVQDPQLRPVVDSEGGW